MLPDRTAVRRRGAGMELAGINPLYLIAGLALLGLAPFLLMMVTSYVKIVVVTSLVRNALGVQQVPPAKRKEFLVQSILAAEQTDRLEKSIRKVVREELQAVNITNAVPSPPPANAIPDSALDFLNSL